MTTRNTRSERVEARTTPETLAVVRQAAQMQGRSLSEFIMASAEEAAKRTIQETQIVRLSVEDQRRFVETLFAAPTPIPAMQRAFAHHQRLIEER